MRNAFQRCAARVVPIILFAALLYNPSPALAAPILGAAQGFAVLGASTVTNTGITGIWGNVGVFAGTSITGFPPGVVNSPGAIYQGGAVAQQAQIDAAIAYNTLASMAFTSDRSGQDLGGLSLTPGVYLFTTSAQLTGTLTLNAQDNPNALFVFQIGTTLTTASGSYVSVINGLADTGVFWQIGSSATLGTGTTFAGNIIANQSITMTTGATIPGGRALALNGAVTMDTGTASNDCISSGCNDFGSAGFSGTASAVPEPGSVTLLGAGLLSLVLCGWRSWQKAA